MAPKPDIHFDDDDDPRAFAFQFSLVLKQLEELERIGDPAKYGLPDLLFEKGAKDSDREHRERQNEALKSCVSNFLWAEKDGKRIDIVLIPEMLEAVADLFFLRVRRAIWWKPRGGGGSLAAAVFIWLMMVYRKMSFLDLAGSGDQAKAVYDYTKQFWSCLLPGTPIITERGLVPVEDVVVGDRVLSEDGLFHAVTQAIRRQKTGKVRRITGAGGWAEGFSVTADHRIFTPGGWRSAEELAPGDLLRFPQVRAKPLRTVVLQDIRETRWSRGGREISRRVVERRRLTGEDLTDFLRLVGYWLADGFFCGGGYLIGFAFGLHENGYIEDIRKIVKRLFGVNVVADRRGTVLRARFSSRLMTAWLSKNCKSGARSKRIPLDLVLGVSETALASLVAGLIRGDGHVGEESRSVQYNTVSEDLALGLWLALNRLGIWSSMSKRQVVGGSIDGRKIKSNYPVFGIRVGGVMGERLVGLIGESFAPAGRSWGRVKFRDGGFDVPVRSIEDRDHDGPVYDLSVDGVHSFAAPGAIFHNCVPGMLASLVDGEPLISRTQLKTGVLLACTPASEKRVRGKHTAGMVIDESCQEQTNTDAVFRSAMQGPLSEEDSVILLLSTFHVPYGFFADTWDGAEDLGFRRYRWDTYDTMRKCEEPFYCTAEEAPGRADDPNLCPLTRYVDDVDDRGNIKGQKAIGCRGKARSSKGFRSWSTVYDAYKINLGTDVFEIEHETTRPGGKTKIFPIEALERSLANDLDFYPGGRKTVGIDWGLVGQTALTLVDRWRGRIELKDPGLKTEEIMAMLLAQGGQDDGRLSALECAMYSGRLTSEAIRLLRKWRAQYGDFTVLADASHPFNNKEVGEAGFRVVPVAFSKWKDYGYENLQRYFRFGRLKILREFVELRKQLKDLRRDKQGKILKAHDHGPDSLMLACLPFRFGTEFPQDVGGAETKDDAPGIILI